MEQVHAAMMPRLDNDTRLARRFDGAKALLRGLVGFHEFDSVFDAVDVELRQLAKAEGDDQGLVIAAGWELWRDGMDSTSFSA